MGIKHILDDPYQSLELSREQIYAELERKEIHTWGDRGAVLQMGKKMDEMVFHEGKRIHSARQQVELLFNWFKECKDRRTRRIGKHWASNMLVERQSVWDEYQDWKEHRDFPFQNERVWNYKFENMTEEEIREQHLIEEEKWAHIVDEVIYGMWFQSNAGQSNIEEDMRSFLENIDPEKNYKEHFLGATFEEREEMIANGTVKIDEVRRIKKKEINTFHSKFITYYQALKVIKTWTQGRTTQYILTNPVFVKRDEPGRRITERLTELHVLYAEIDHYSKKANMTYRDLTAQQVGKLIIEKLKMVGFPLPTEIVYSRGVQLYWKMAPVPSYRLEEWKVLMGYINEMLAEFGADSKALDAVRVLRAVGSVHEKTEEVITGVSYSYDRYDFDELFDTFCKLRWEQTQKEEREKRIALLKQQEKYAETSKEKVFSKKKWMIENGYLDAEGNPTESYNINKKKVHSKRLNEEAKNNFWNYVHANKRAGVFWLCNIRAGHMEGCREFACFYIRYLTLCMTGGNSIEALHQMRDLYDRFVIASYTWDEMLERTKSAEDAYKRWVKDERKGYNYTTKRLIKELGITEQEMKKMKYIVTPERSYELTLEYNRSYKAEKDYNSKHYEKRRVESGKLSRTEQKAIRIGKIQEYLKGNPGASQRQIADDTGIPQQTVQRLLKEC
ncbi:TPA: MarR family transcriptional regulator [Bacillus thuringiensis]|nr:MarR family transcriptional regulator [Bacillus thuringiensis]